jgi:putative protease
VHDTKDSDSGDVQVIKFDLNQAWSEQNDNFTATDIVRHPLADKTYLIEEATRSGEMMPILEDEHGTYIMNSKDLRAIQHVEKLIAVGVDSLKIEGRTKSLYYVARTAQTYRRAIDDALAGRPFNPQLYAELEGLANRGYTDGFLERHQSHETQNYIDGFSNSKSSQFVGEVLSVDKDGGALVDVKNKFCVGDKIEIIHPSGNQIVVLQSMLRDGVPVVEAAGAGHLVVVPNMHGKEKALLAKIL